MPIEVYDITSGCGDHVVQFYERDPDLVRAVGQYLLDGLRAREVCLVVATAAHRRAFESTLRAAGVDLDELRGQGMYLTLDAATALSRFHADGQVDRDRFNTLLGGVLHRAAAMERPVRAYGEMVALLWDAGYVSTAIEVEDLWNELRRRIPFSLFCAYPSRSVSGPDHSVARAGVCRLHSGVQQHFEAAFDAPRRARFFVVDTLRSQGHGGVLLEDAALAVGELATNACVHARSPFTVVVSSLSDAVRLSVHDASCVLPVPRLAETYAQSGRGLGLVAALASSWGMARTMAGKVVWAEFLG
jgi:anti-sigma regulatory factor (Ser/Thr protein kinase)